MPRSAAGELGTLYRLALAVQRAVRDAGGSPRRSDVVGIGATGSPTEAIDRLAETTIVEGLEAERVDWNVVSEEAGTIARGGDRTLVVDPIDGTSNALRRLPFSSVSLALGAGTLGGIDLGLVRDLARGTTWWAARGDGAYVDGRRIRPRPWTKGREVLLVNLGIGASERCSRLAATAQRVRSLGCASLEMALVAQGSADGYVFEAASERNLRPTDIAGAYRIVLEAGGGVSAADGGSLDGLPLSAASRTSALAWGDAAFGRSLRSGGP